MANLPELKRVYDHIAALPNVEDIDWLHTPFVDNVWDQSVWCEVGSPEEEGICGTAACFAGWTCILNGLDAHGLGDDCSIEAAVILELDLHRSASLFTGSNTLDNIRSIINQIAWEQTGQENFIPQED